MKESITIKSLKKIGFRLLIVLALLSWNLSIAQELETGEWAFRYDGTPAVMGQATRDHLFVRNTYNDTGTAQTYDNVVSFKSGAIQTVWLWLDDDEIYENVNVQYLTPTAYDESGNLYNEITYNSFQCDIYLPEGFSIVKVGSRSYVQGDRMPNNAEFNWGDPDGNVYVYRCDAFDLFRFTNFNTYDYCIYPLSVQSPRLRSVDFTQKEGTKVIDGITYNVYTIILYNNQDYGTHLSSRTAEQYEEYGALKKDDAPVLGLFIQNDNSSVQQGRLADIIIANLEFGMREPFKAIPQWEPNEYRFFYGVGGNNESQRFQYYNRIALYGNKGITDDQSNSEIIDFADANVKALCVQNWDTNGDGEISKYEAANVNSLNNVFENNSTIETFNELEYFTGLSEIGANDFRFCSSLSQITIPNSVHAIGECAFQECSQLNNIVIPDIVEEIGDHAFDYSGLTQITLGNSLKRIGNNAFTGCQFSSLTLPEGLLTIGENAFSECAVMEAINLPGTLTSIGDLAFDMCGSLSGITIPASVTHIGSEAFEECHSLISMLVEPTNNVYDSRENCNAIIETSTNTLISGCKNSFIPNTITAIGDYAFVLCSGLDSISIPESVGFIGNNAFIGCPDLKDIIIGSNVSSIGEYAFLDCEEVRTVTCLASIPPSMFGQECFSSCVYDNAVLKVPSASLGGYTLTDYWNRFLHVEIITNGDVDENKNIYIVGNDPFGNWDPNNGVMMNNNGDGTYSIKKTVNGTIWFVFGDGQSEDWTTFDREYRFGPNTGSDQSVEVGSWIGTQKQGNSNGAYKLPAKSSGSTEYKFTFDLNNMSFIVEDNFDRWDQLQDGVYWDGSTLYICSFVTSLGDLGVNPTAIYSFASVPPTCTDNTFTGYGAYLTMPPASYGAYFTAEYWCNFAYMYNDAVETTGITLSDSEVNLIVGESISLTANVSPNNASYQGTLWRSTNKQVATVNYEGQITAQAAGECDIIASCVFYQAVCHVKVEDSRIVISLDKHEASILPNHALTITPTMSPQQTTLKLNVSDPNVAAARLMNGVIQVVGLREGTTVIEVSSEDGLAIPDTCIVTVYTEPGDVNCDGFINISDVTKLIDYLLSGNPDGMKVDNADINRDENVNISDVTSLIDYLLSGNWPWEVPVQGWPANYDGVMLQGFYWDSFNDTRWPKLESQADELAEFFKLIWIPQSASCGSTSMGYNPLYWFTNYNSSFGSEFQLRSMINTFKAKGIGTIADVVLNHRMTTNDWVTFPTEVYNGITYKLESTDICKNDDGGSTLVWANNYGYELSSNDDTAEDWNGIRDLDHLSENVQYNVKAYLNMLLNDLGYAGFRYDMTKGYAASVTGKYNSAAGPDFSVGEYWDGSTSAVKNWIDGTRVQGIPQSAAFDFPLRYTIRDAVNNNNWSNLASGNGGLALLPNYRRYAVTFVENHDTQYRSAQQQNDPIRNNVEAANAFMLAMPGTPCIFLKHWIEYKESIKQMIYARQLAGITNTSTTNIIDSNESANYYVQSTSGENGSLLAAMGATSYQVPNSYVVVTSGINYRLALSKSTETAWVSKPSGEYDASFNVTLTAVSQTAGVELVYTLDGTEPTANNGIKVSDGTSISISNSVTLKVGLIVNGQVSGVITRNYVLDTEPFVPFEITVYLKDPTVAPNNWPMVNFFSWDCENQMYNGNWPGQTITATKIVNGDKFYYQSYTINDKDYYMNFVFNQGSGYANTHQTIDVTDVNKTSFFEVTTQTNKFEVREITNDYLPYINQ